MVLLICLGAAAAVGAGWWLVQLRVSDEKLIQELVAKAEHGVEAKSVEEIMDCLSRDFEGQGDMSREDVWRLAMQWQRSPLEADVVIQDQRITVEGREATGQFHVQVELVEEGLPRPSLVAFLTVGFERRWRGLRKTWRVRSVRGFDPDAILEEAL